MDSNLSMIEFVCDRDGVLNDSLVSITWPAGQVIDTKESLRTPSLSQTNSIIERLESIKSNKGDVSVGELRERMQKTVQKRFGVYRESETLKLGNDELASMSQDLKHIKVKDQSDVFNTDLVEALELHNLMQVAGSVGVSAEQRTESRGCLLYTSPSPRDV